VVKTYPLARSAWMADSIGIMFLRVTNRCKDGKDHRYYSVVENRRVGGGKHVQKTLLYLGEINDTQKAAWTRTIDTIEERQHRQVALFPEDRAIPEGIDEQGVQVRLKELELLRPRQWGACWLACELWDQLELDSFWKPRLAASRKGTEWLNVLKTLSCYRLIDPGSEWRLHRYWFDHSAMADLLGEDFRIAQKDTLYRCHDRLLEHKEDLFRHLKGRWQSLFDARCEVLLYDLTSTYFESDPPFPQQDKRRFGYSRDKRSDCVQVVIALVVTPDGFPLGYEVMAGNTADNTTLRGFLKKIERLHGKAERVWVMDRGIPTEEVLAEMRTADTPVYYLVGTPKGRLSRYEQALLEQPWKEVREDISVKLLQDREDIYIYAQSNKRIHKERAMRKRRLKHLLRRLQELRNHKTITRDSLLMKLGAAQKEAGRAYGLLDITLPASGEPITVQTFRWRINRSKYRRVYRREGRYLLRSNLPPDDPAKLWQYYVQLTEIEEAFRNLKGDLAIRPIHHQVESRIEAHIFIAFLAYCLHVTLKQRCRQSAAGLTPRSVLEQLKAIQMIDIQIPTVDGRWLKMSRFTKPDTAQQLLLAQLKLILPPQPPPEISRTQFKASCGEDL
jgi:transposase